MSSGFLKGAAAGLISLVLAGCALQAEGAKGLVPAMPKHYDGSSSRFGPNFSTDWIALFGMPELTRIAHAALDGNFDIGAAGARLAQAQAQALAAGAALYPQIGGSGSASRSMTPGTLRSKEPPFDESVGNRFSLGITASYALDFWGRNRAIAEAGNLSATATRYDYETVAVSTLAAICNAYFQVLVAQERIRIARENIRTAEGVLKALRLRVEVGTGNALDVAQQETIIANLRAGVPALEQVLQQQRNLLAVLAGHVPEGRKARGGNLRAVRLPAVRPGLPSTLLLRRPDIASAEFQLKAADANIYAARAAFYPSITLTTGASLESIALKNLLRPEALALSVASGLTQPIFDGYNLEAQLAANRARWLELLNLYRKSIVSALSDVENALIAVRKTSEAEALRARAVVTARRASELTRQRLDEGTIDITVLLNTQQTLFNAQDALALARFQRLQALVSLFQALGGGFERPPPEKESPSASLPATNAGGGR